MKKRFINKQTFQFEVQYLVESETKWDAQDEPLNGLNIISISDIDTDRPWDSEELADWEKTPTITKEEKNQLTKTLDEIIRLAHKASLSFTIKEVK